ncbi:tRNA (guanine-N1)-methyltransferase [Thiohalorhabdus denitrificans]|uniref:tRNA (guanine-N(1)-)-methyltransferase n=1 Tax=Thiohalorhabdus denitrificans TaxID=381306 RepID=A0A0P9GJF0_9GAMM|nr:tRNA (guanosine(37)-N1)-methyltransferase TrmD [Thiohalorhabdus denitrificans]KPV40223.1 tRNA (guanine-N1)-methyltransferase [Thiohalorhabdus denitrificans]SCX84008.1 tRNA (Guanine37-N(1)-) methyltransferase [Thiohalorhabdus denitrificans]
MRFHVLTLFPGLFESVLSYGVLGRAVEQGHLGLELTDIRDFSRDRHRTVDDRPFGGGPGMVMRPEVTAAAVDHARARMPAEAPVVYLSPQGETLDHQKVAELADLPGLTLLCGRYEGIDERALESRVDRELSIGDYVLSGGELAALVVIDAVSRLQPEVLGEPASAAEDSFVEGLLDCPHYTRPQDFEGRAVPEVLLSGDHGRIRQWRRQQALARTWERRPELLRERGLSGPERALLSEYIRETGGDPAALEELPGRVE